MFAKSSCNFGTSVVAGGNLVAGHDGALRASGGRISRVAALRRDVAVNQTDTRDPVAAIHLRHQARGGKSVIAAIASL